MLTSFLIGFTVLCAIFDDRLFINVGGGGAGELPLVPLMAVAVATFAVARRGPRTMWFCAAPLFLIGVFPYVALTIVLPIAGVVLADFPDRTMLGMLSGISAFAFLVIGAVLNAEPGRRWTRWLLLGITIQLVYAIGQAASLGGGLVGDLFAPFHAWDLSLVDIQTFVQARSTGLFLNPNELGFWAALTTVLSLTLLQGRARYAGAILAVATLILSESRGSIVALIAALAVGVFLAWRRGMLGWRALRSVAVGVGLLAVILFFAFQLRPSDTGATRLFAIVDVVTQGPEADRNLSGRIEFWQSALDYLDKQPFGTLGSPELALGTAIDNDWFRALAKGSVPYLGAVLLLVLTPVAVRRGPRREALWLSTVVIGVAAISQIPLDYPAIVLFWVLLGGGIQAQVRLGRHVERRGPESVARRPVPGT